MTLFSNNNYFSYCTFMIITIVSSFSLLETCGGLEYITCHQLLIYGHMALVYLICQSIKQTKMYENQKMNDTNNIMVRYVIDSVFLIICLTIIFTYRLKIYL